MYLVVHALHKRPKVVIVEARFADVLDVVTLVGVWRPAKAVQVFAVLRLTA